MALHLAVPAGKKVMVGVRHLTVKETLSLHRVRVIRDDGGEIDLTDDKSVEVFPHVFVSVGTRTQLGMASLAFEAPKDIMILREDLADHHAV